jgi:hypothetical protein
MHRKIKIHFNKPTEEKPGEEVERETNITKLSKEFHAAIGSKNHDYLLFFNDKDVIKCFIEVKESPKAKLEGITHRIKNVELKTGFNIMNI